MPRPDLEGLKKLEEEATNGPWVEKTSSWGFWEVATLGDTVVFDDGSAGDEYGKKCTETDRDFIVALRNSFPSILEYIEELEKELALVRSSEESITEDVLTLTKELWRLRELGIK